MIYKKVARIGGVIAVCGLLTAAVASMTGCEMDSFFDQSTVGRWEQTPVTMPILDRLDIIEPTSASDLPITSVRPGDLVPDVHEYVIGPGDLLTVTIFELLQPGQNTIENRRVTDTGYIRLPVVGQVRAAGRSAAQLEKAIADILDKKGVLQNATVSVVLQQQRQNTFSIIGQPQTGGTAVGTYVIPMPNFRLLDALAMAHGVPGQTKSLLIFRQTALSPEVTGEAQQQQEEKKQGKAGKPAPTKPSELINQLMQGIDQNKGEPKPKSKDDGGAAPAGMDSGLGNANAASQWVVVNGKYVHSSTPAAGSDTSSEVGDTGGETPAELKKLSQMVTERIIEIPYNRLSAGDMRYNIVIRPGDVIKVPDQNAGFVYAMGQINRPGAYTVPGEKDLTIKQLVASAGGLSQTGVPERVDLVRRVGADHEAVVRLNVRKIFDGTEPDIFLKPNDLLNFGTNFPATPMAVFRNGLRMTYGFGFILDRNFSTQAFGP